MMSWPEIEDSKDVFEYASHTHNLHFEDENNICAFLSSSKETIENDLTKSRLLLNNTPYIAYPYGKIDENTINIVKNLGFTMGFTVSEGNIKPGDNIYMLKRQAIFQSTTLDQFKKIVGID
jgi:peptidoglycan/xylan/chitin deacetylase (PgdA/CDA1 family)